MRQPSNFFLKELDALGQPKLASLDINLCVAEEDGRTKNYRAVLDFCQGPDEHNAFIEELPSHVFTHVGALKCFLSVLRKLRPEWLFDNAARFFKFFDREYVLWVEHLGVSAVTCEHNLQSVGLHVLREKLIGRIFD